MQHNRMQYKPGEALKRNLSWKGQIRNPVARNGVEMETFVTKLNGKREDRIDSAPRVREEQVRPVKREF